MLPSAFNKLVVFHIIMEVEIELDQALQFEVSKILKEQNIKIMFGIREAVGIPQLLMAYIKDVGELLAIAYILWQFIKEQRKAKVQVNVFNITVGDKKIDLANIKSKEELEKALKELEKA